MAVKKWRGLLFAGVALLVYVFGGISVMVGLILIGIIGERELWGWGRADSIGYLFFGVGLCLTILGVLVMRIMRNRQIA